jgi:hypothetical protein
MSRILGKKMMGISRYIAILLSMNKNRKLQHLIK